jgi:hypothetical protein
VCVCHNSSSNGGPGLDGTVLESRRSLLETYLWSFVTQPDRGAWACLELGLFLRTDVKVFSRQAVEAALASDSAVKVRHSTESELGLGLL